jgi:hypothetical protein
MTNRILASNSPRRIPPNPRLAEPIRIEACPVSPSRKATWPEACAFALIVTAFALLIVFLTIR